MTTEQTQEPTQVEPEDQSTTETEPQPEPEQEPTEEKPSEGDDDGDDEAAEGEEQTSSEFHPNKKQQEVKEVFDLMREEGVETPNATKYAVTALPRPSKKFVEWLSDGSMTVTKGKVTEREVA